MAIRPCLCLIPLAFFTISTLQFLACLFLLSAPWWAVFNVVILRLPLILEQTWQEEAALILDQIPRVGPPVTLWGPRSACPSCSSTIRAYDNIPVVSFVLLQGRCRDCSTKISLRYPLIELFTGLVTLGLLVVLDWNASFAAALVLSYGLIALTFIDFDHQILPDQITLPGIWIGLLLNLDGIFCSLEEAVIELWLDTYPSGLFIKGLSSRPAKRGWVSGILNCWLLLAPGLDGWRCPVSY